MVKNINYKLIKRGDKVVLFLHGLGGDLSVWQFMEQSISKRNFSYLALDIPGHGLSPRIHKHYKINNMVKDIETLLIKLGFKQIILVGHCFGGMLALELCLKFPGRIQKQVLICSSYKLPFWSKMINLLLTIGKNLPFGPIYKHVNFSKFKKTGDLNFKRLYSDILHVGIKSYARLFNSFVGWNIQDKLGQIKTKTIIIAGKKDSIYPPKTQLKMCLLMPKAKLEWVEANHIAPVSRQKEIKKIIIKYV